MKAFISKRFASYIQSKNRRWIENPIKYQKKIFQNLIKKGRKTAFGKDHKFDKVQTYKDFQTHVSSRDYEGLKPYFDRVVEGESDVLWVGKPIYLSKTSGTTSGVKYIPITREFMPTYSTAARDALLNYIYTTGKADFVRGKHIFLQGSPVLSYKNGIPIGRLSGIAAHRVPHFLRRNRLPSWKTNCIDDWEAKIDAIVNETLSENMTLIGGIPSWVQMYFERLAEKTKKPVGRCFKNFSLFVYGGVNFEPYKANFERLIGRKVDGIELFPASEGFFAYQDQRNDEGLLLLVNNGIFYEFIAASEFFSEKPKRCTLEEVSLGANYVMIISTTAGLWAYNLGDTIKFVSLKPFRIIVTGRIKHYISAFGEHVIGVEVERALKKAIENSTELIVVREFTVAPQLNSGSELPFHEWFIEFEKTPSSLEHMAQLINVEMQRQNIYYDDLIVGKILQPLKIRVVSKNGFESYMKSVGKLGGQNKVPRLSNDRKIASALENYDKR